MKNASFVTLFVAAFVGFSAICQPAAAVPYNVHPWHPSHPTSTILCTPMQASSITTQLDVLTTSCTDLKAHEKELVDLKAGVIEKVEIPNVFNGCHDAFESVAVSIDSCTSLFANIKGTKVAETIQEHIGISITNVHGSLEVVLSALVDVRAQIEASSQNVEVFVKICVDITEKLKAFLSSIDGTVDVEAYAKIAAKVQAVITLVDDKKGKLQ